jgi:hypothetical protein
MGRLTDLQERLYAEDRWAVLIVLRAIVPRPQTCRDAVRSAQAHPQARPTPTARPTRAQDEFTLAAIAQNLRRLSKFAVRPPPQAPTCVA